jgi:hypothetical protein
VTIKELEAAAAALVETDEACRCLDELMAGMAGCFRRWEPRATARKYVRALMSDLPRKDCWTIAEHAGDPSPGRTSLYPALEITRGVERADHKGIAGVDREHGRSVPIEHVHGGLGRRREWVFSHESSPAASRERRGLCRFASGAFLRR